MYNNWTYETQYTEVEKCEIHQDPFIIVLFSLSSHLMK